MLGQGEDDRLPAAAAAAAAGKVARKAYLRSVSWSDRSPTKPNPRTQTNSKARPCLPPLQPLSIARRPVEEWPTAGSDDLGVWPNPQTPRASIEPLKDSNVEQPPVREFQFKKDKLAFFDKECSRIADHLYLGSDAVAKNREILRQNGITHVLNCVGFVCPEYFKNDLVYKTLWLQDSPSEDITSILYDVFDYFEEVREQGGRVLVHCCQGVSRSTSLVIAYLMWRDGQSFEDAFQYVKAARGVTNPNMGFACQLLQCQKRVHAVPASPNSLLRMYRMAPHSSYDPLHLVPKMLSQPGIQGLDSRGAFIIHVPTAIYVWVGKKCDSAMSNQANVAANQFIRYERFRGPILSVNEGEESLEFWTALTGAPGNDSAASRMVDQRKVDDYDLDFELFHKALAGGLVPPSTVSSTGSETCLPARESGWSRLRQKFASDRMREFVTSRRLNSGITPSTDTSDIIRDICNESKEHVLPSSPPFASPCDSPRSFDCYLDGSPDRVINATKGEETSASFVDSSLPPLPPCSPDSFPCSPEVNPKFGYKSPTLSPSTSDYSSSSFAFSPSSSNWSDLSYLSSQQPSPSGLETIDPFPAKNVPLADNFCLHCKEASLSEKNVISANQSLKMEKTCLPCKGSSPSIAERRGSMPPPRMVVPSVDESPQAPRNLVRSWSFSLPELDDADYMKDVDDEPHEDESSKEECMLDVDSGSESEIDEGKDHTISSYLLTSKIEEVEEVTTPVLYQWPSMHIIAIDCFSILDSGSVYFLLASDLHLQSTTNGVLYVWLGEKFLCDKGLIGSKDGNKDIHRHWEAIGRNFLNQVDSPSAAAVQVIREGEEPEPFLNILNSFSFQKAEKRSHS